MAGLARRRSAQATLAFLDQVLDEMPFPIQRIQTDRGTEFFAESVQRRLMDEAIRFRPIPPRSPHLNGKVERVQRTVLEEFWPQPTQGQPMWATSSRYGSITIIGIARMSRCMGIRPSSGYVSGLTRRHSGSQSARPMTLGESTSRSVTIPLRWRYER